MAARKTTKTSIALELVVTRLTWNRWEATVAIDGRRITSGVKPSRGRAIHSLSYDASKVTSIAEIIREMEHHL